MFSFVLTKIAPVNAAIAAIGDEQYVPVRYPGAVIDPDTGQLISNAQVAETQFTAFADTDQPSPPGSSSGGSWMPTPRAPCSLLWRYHPFFTNNREPLIAADLTHRQHAICETVWSDLIEGPWNHQPSGLFAANAGWTILAAITHNLMRAAATLTGTRFALACGATLGGRPRPPGNRTPLTHRGRDG